MYVYGLILFGVVRSRKKAENVFGQIWLNFGFENAVFGLGHSVPIKSSTVNPIKILIHGAIIILSMLSNTLPSQKFGYNKSSMLSNTLPSQKFGYNKYYVYSYYFYHYRLNTNLVSNSKKQIFVIRAFNKFVTRAKFSKVTQYNA